MPSDAVKRIKEMSRSGLSQREVADRAGLKRSTVYGIVRGKHGLSPERAERVRANLEQTDREYRVRLFDEQGKLVTVDAVNKRERDKARAYMESFQKYGRGQVSVDKLQGYQIKVTSKDGVTIFQPASDRQVLYKLFESDEAREIRFWRERGSP